MIDAMKGNQHEILDLLLTQPVHSNQQYAEHPRKQLMQDVFNIISKECIFSVDQIFTEIDYYVRTLGLDNYYFSLCNT